MRPVDPWLLVFDLDGTLIDSSLDLCLSVNAALAHVGARELPHDLITTFVGDGAATLVQRALESSIAESAKQELKIERLENALHAFLEFYRQHKLDNTRPYPHVESALATIRHRRPDLPMAVLTNKPVTPSRQICEALGLAPYFFANYGGNSFSTKKPDPLGLNTLVTEARSIWLERGIPAATLPPNGAVLIGDSDADVFTARHAGIRSLGCLYGLAPDRLAQAKPDALCASPAEWPELLGMCD